MALAASYLCKINKLESKTHFINYVAEMTKYGEKRLLSVWKHAIVSTDEAIVFHFSLSIAGLAKLVDKSLEQAKKKIVIKFDLFLFFMLNIQVLKNLRLRTFLVLGMVLFTVVSFLRCILLLFVIHMRRRLPWRLWREAIPIL